MAMQNNMSRYFAMHQGGKALLPPVSTFLLLLPFLFLFFCPPAMAVDTAVCIDFPEGSATAENLQKALSYYEDRSADRSLQSLLDDHGLVWNPLQEEIASFGFTSSVFWLQFALCGSRQPGEKKVLEITYPLLDHIQVFGLLGEKIVYQSTSGDALPFADRPIQHRNFVFFLPEQSEDLRFFIRIATKSAMQIPLQVSTETQFFQNNQRSLLLQGLYFGIILAMVFYNACLFVFLRDRSYLLYVVFTSAYLSFQGVFQGLFQQFFFNSVWLNDHTLLIFGFISIIFANLFAVSFLNLATNNILISRALRFISWLSALAAMLASILPYEIMVKLMLCLAIPSSLFILSAGCKLWWLGHRPARIFTVAWSTLLVSFVFASFNKVGLVPRTFWTENVLQIGGLLEVVLLSIALAERINEEKRQRILAEQRLSTSLEEKVAERTVELNNVLQQLETANLVLSQISHTDSLTQIGNRRSFDLQLALDFKSAAREKTPLALIMLDIDHFKQFNDTYGHQVGDHVLRAVAQALKVHAARPGDSIFRYGGEEFAVLLGNTDLAGGGVVAEKMRNGVEKMVVHIEEHTFFVTISGGLGIYAPSDTTTPIKAPEDLIRQVDMQLYKAKANGRNRIES